MKKFLLPLLICVVLLVSAVNTGYALPVSQVSADGSDDLSMIELIGVFSEFVSAGIETAGQQLYSLDLAEISGGDSVQPEPENPDQPLLTDPLNTETEPETPLIEWPEMPEIETPAEPEPVPEMPVITEPVQEDPGNAAPEDPESAAVSTEIEVSDFYNDFKRDLKELGRHSVSFEEKGGKNTSRIDVDDGIAILLHYEKTRSGNMIERITYKAEFTDERQWENADIVFYTLIGTLCKETDIDFEDAKYGSVFDTVAAGKSVAAGSLLFYGTAKTEGEQKALTVKIYYTGE